MPCLNCSTQFTIFKRKRSCNSCCNYYCVNCLSKRDKNVCLKCHKILEFRSSKNQLMQLNTKDLKFFLQSRKINISGIVEKEELCNLIINHLNNNAYHEHTATTTTTSSASSSTTPNNDFENYAQSFDHIKQTCQNIFSTITDKIASDLQKTTCFNQQPTTQQRRDNVTTEQPRPRSSNNSNNNNPMSPPPPMYQSSSSAATSAFSAQQQNNPGTSQSSANVHYNRNQQPPSRSDLSNDPKTHHEHHHDCHCSDDDEIDEISEKRQSIFNAAPGSSGTQFNAKKTKLSNSSSMESSSFEEVVVAGKSDDDWLFVEKANRAATSTVNSQENNQSSSPSQVNNNDSVASSSFIHNNSNNNSDVGDIRKIARRRSDSSLLSLRQPGNFTIDASSFNPLQSASEVKKSKISCRKCGKAKTKIKQEILKLSEQLKSSNRSEDEVNAKIKEFMDYLESNHASEMTETGESQAAANDPLIPNSSSHDEIEENIFDENEGINVYGSEEGGASSQQHHFNANQQQQPSCSVTGTPKRFISLNDIRSSDEFEAMNVKQLKEILMLNRVDFKGCCEKNELKERVKRLWESHVSAPPPEQITTDDLCKICMDAPIECVFLECGHTATCTQCGKVLSECPICRSYIVRVVRIFKS